MDAELANQIRSINLKSDFINTFVSQSFFAISIKCFYDDNFIGAEVISLLTFRSQ